MNVPGQYSRNPNPKYTSNVEMADAIDDSPVFQSIDQQLQHEREAQAMRHWFVYPLNGEVVGQQTLPFTIQIENGSDFKCMWITGSCFSYSGAQASTFPVPNSIGATAWAGRGLSTMITDTRSGRQLTSDFVGLETLLTPGYGMTMVDPMPFRYFFWRNSKIRFDIRNRDNANRTHQFSLNLVGIKIYSPA